MCRVSKGAHFVSQWCIMVVVLLQLASCLGAPHTHTHAHQFSCDQSLHDSRKGDLTDSREAQPGGDASVGEALQRLGDAHRLRVVVLGQASPGEDGHDGGNQHRARVDDLLKQNALLHIDGGGVDGARVEARVPTQEGGSKVGELSSICVEESAASDPARACSIHVRTKSLVLADMGVQAWFKDNAEC